MLRFDWDDANREHIARHNVLPHEVEEVFGTETFEVGYSNVLGEDRYEELGATWSGRILFVVTTARGDLLRVVTAYDASRNQKRTWYEFERSRHE